MPIHIAAKAFFEGLASVPGGWAVFKIVSSLGLIYLLKWYFNGAVNTSERNMHSKVVIMTGGTSGIGAEVAKQLAQRGAQLVLLTQHPLSDPFLVDYIMDLRTQANNELITAEHVDLANLHSIRKFATKWVDNAPPRRLDMIILCADVRMPPGGGVGGKLGRTKDGLERSWGVNYLANWHLLSILSPAIRVQPPDRDVRVIVGTCSSYMGGVLPQFEPETSKGPKANRPTKKSEEKPAATPGSAYATSKLALMTFAIAFEKRLQEYARPDKQPMNARVILVDPGFTRTPGMRRFLSFGSLWGLALYLFMWPVWWLILKSADQGAQTFLYAAMEAQYGRGKGGVFLKECREMKILKGEVQDEEAQKILWEGTEKLMVGLEKESALKRAREKAEKGETEDDGKGKKLAGEGNGTAGVQQRKK
ncbi:NAD(P)-binding protein [Amniculicola lignicola CBS 123094]|uniref:NAD(P)-binding protein n=1 Tax=Amniculicola lignicola CBS 123094 TaxID=1392246 RepID=A0A6A5VZZ6_9PLEO|nr:NAD(P)-binding protein [Amniculicola lignicola CBS 123094]